MVLVGCVVGVRFTDWIFWGAQVNVVVFMCGMMLVQLLSYMFWGD